MVYFIAMVAYPFWNYDWKHVQNVWDRWQGFNVGMIAFLSSVVAFNISKYNSEQQRIREFESVRPFLPQSLSKLIDYLELCSEYLKTKRSSDDLDPTGKYISPPTLPDGYKNVFENCIRHATADVGNYLALILNKLQVLDSRLNPNDRLIHIAPTNNMIYTYNVAEIYFLVNRSFAIGRGEKDFELKEPSFEDFKSTYSMLRVNFSDDNLELLNKTKRFLKNK